MQHATMAGGVNPGRTAGWVTETLVLNLGLVSPTLLCGMVFERCFIEETFLGWVINLKSAVKKII